jgi:hypothetical protein
LPKSGQELLEVKALSIDKQQRLALRSHTWRPLIHLDLVRSGEFAWTIAR